MKENLIKIGKREPMIKINCACGKHLSIGTEPGWEIVIRGPWRFKHECGNEIQFPSKEIFKIIKIK